MSSEREIMVRLDALESRAACERLVWAYAQAFDHRDETLMRSIWHEDALLALGEPFGDAQGADAILEVARRLWDKTPRMHHWMSNPLLELDGDAAAGVSALDAFMLDSESGPTHVGGEYRDRFERRDGRWAIAQRTFELHYWTPIAGWKPEAGSDAAFADAGPPR